MNMMLEQRIVQLLHKLDDKELYKVLGYVEAHIPTPKPRELGTARGFVLYMAEDFNAPLDDFAEYQ